MKLVEGRNTVLDWQHITLSHGRDRIGRDIIIAHGPEPDLAWHRFVKELTDAAVNLGVSTCAHLGAYPFSCPHTRPSRLSMTTASEDLLATLPFLRSTLDVPGGIGSALEHSLHDADIPTLGIWAQVPHYAATMPYPAAAVALLDGLRDALDLVTDGTDLRSTMVEHRERLDNLVRDNSEHEQMLKQLEVAHDAQLADEPGIDPMPPTIGEISADELSEQVERFLRGHD
jgi:predicted ATP-grasp superfamily ATP-dependent carboligase